MGGLGLGIGIALALTLTLTLTSALTSTLPLTLTRALTLFRLGLVAAGSRFAAAGRARALPSLGVTTPRPRRAACPLGRVRVCVRGRNR